MSSNGGEVIFVFLHIFIKKKIQHFSLEEMKFLF